MNFKALRYTLTHPSNTWLVLGMVAITVLAIYGGGGVLGTVIGLVAVAMAVWVYQSGYASYATAVLEGQEAAVKNWVQDATDAHERARRQLRAASMTASALVEAERLTPFEPLVNIDGTPMVPGVGLDINGVVYGASEVSGPIHMNDGSWSSSPTAYGGIRGLDD